MKTTRTTVCGTLMVYAALAQTAWPAEPVGVADGLQLADRGVLSGRSLSVGAGRAGVAGVARSSSVAGGAPMNASQQQMIAQASGYVRLRAVTTDGGRRWGSAVIVGRCSDG